MKKMLLALTALVVMAFGGNLEDGLTAYKNKDYKKAMELYQKAADQGYAVAQLNLGFMYMMGNGVKKDRIKAYQLWTKAAKQGNTKAQGNLDKLCNNSPWACK